MACESKNVKLENVVGVARPPRSPVNPAQIQLSSNALGGLRCCRDCASPYRDNSRVPPGRGSYHWAAAEARPSSLLLLGRCHAPRR